MESVEVNRTRQTQEAGIIAVGMSPKAGCRKSRVEDIESIEKPPLNKRTPKDHLSPNGRRVKEQTRPLPECGFTKTPGTFLKERDSSLELWQLRRPA